MTARLQRWRRSAALTAIVALFFHAALLVLHTPTQASANDDSVVLCTSLGLETVALADLDDGTSIPSPDKNSGSTISHCPVCLGAQLSGLAVMPGETILPPRAVAACAAQPIQSETIFAARLITGTGPRAPPSIV
jgi:hypothetical protein